MTFGNERSAVQLFCYPKEVMSCSHADSQCLAVTVTPSVRVSAGLKHLKLLTTLPPKTFVPSWESSASCYLYRIALGVFCLFVCLY